jgi:hypothetical protein
VSAQSTWGLWERSGTSWRRLGTFNAESECRPSAISFECFADTLDLRGPRRK